MTQGLRWMARAWKYRLKIDPGEIHFIRRYLSPGDLAVDIGAHKGAYAWWMRAAVGKKGRVVAFEPNPSLARKLATLVNGKPNIRVENLGVSTGSETRTLVIPEHSAQEASYEIEGDPSARTIETRTVSLDDYFQDRQQPIKLIKCDVEGHELAVFRGAGSILEKDRPALLFECENRHLGQHSIRDIFDYLRERGFHGYFFQGKQTIPIDRLKDSMLKHGSKDYVYNYLFLPQPHTD